MHQHATSACAPTNAPSNRSAGGIKIDSLCLWFLVFGFWFLVFDLTEGSLSGRITQSGVSERAGPSYAPDSGWQFVVGFTQNKALKTSLVERNELVVTCSPLFRSFSG